MATTVAQIMSRNPWTVRADAPVREAAQQMRANDTGNLVVLDDNGFAGILTDRDIVVRILAEGKDGSAPVRDACGGQDLVTVTPDTTVEQAVELIRDRGIRRLPVMEGERVVGLLSVGDLAVDLDERWGPADISAARPDR